MPTNHMICSFHGLYQQKLGFYCLVAQLTTSWGPCGGYMLDHNFICINPLMLMCHTQDGTAKLLCRCTESITTLFKYTLNWVLIASMSNTCRLRHELIPDWMLLLTAHYGWIERDILMVFQTTKYFLRRKVWRKIL